jgi:hypothetical protein
LKVVPVIGREPEILFKISAEIGNTILRGRLDSRFNRTSFRLACPLHYETAL